MAKGIWNIDQTPPGMFPLNPSPEIEGMLCIFQDGQEDEDRPVSQEKSYHERRREDSPQDREDRRIGRGRQEENHSGGAAEDFQKDKKNKNRPKAGDIGMWAAYKGIIRKL